MKIALPPVQKEEGGSGSFRRRWRMWLSAQNIPWTEDLDGDDYDVLFINAWQTPYRVVYHHKKRLPHLRVVHRIDGSAADYGRTDGADYLQGAVNRLADATIFQSDYSRHSTTEKYPVIGLDGPVIYNPVDTEHFKPAVQHETSSLKVISAIWSPNPRKGGWRVPMLAAANPDIEFILITRNDYDLPSNVTRLDLMDHQALAETLRQADVFLNLSQNDPCPNVVIEAMASGLPVLYVPSGGVPELVAEEAGLPFESDAQFRPQLERIRADLSGYQHGARQRTIEHFQKDKIFAEYLNVVQSTQRRPLPTRREDRRARWQVRRYWLQSNWDHYRRWLLPS